MSATPYQDRTAVYSARLNIIGHLKPFFDKHSVTSTEHICVFYFREMLSEKSYLYTLQTKRNIISFYLFSLRFGCQKTITQAGGFWTMLLCKMF